MDGLYMVSQVGHVEIVKCLLPQPDIDVKQTLENGETGLLVATCNDNTTGRQSGLALLIHPDIEVDARNANRGFPLLLACSYGCTETALMLIAHPHINVNLLLGDHLSLLLQPLAMLALWPRL
jgi:ankyrin repeat protein